MVNAGKTERDGEARDTWLAGMTYPTTTLWVGRGRRGSAVTVDVHIPTVGRRGRERAAEPVRKPPGAGAAADDVDISHKAEHHHQFKCSLHHDGLRLCLCK